MTLQNDPLLAYGLTTHKRAGVLLHLVTQNSLSSWLSQQENTQAIRKWLTQTGFNGEAGQICLLPDEKAGTLAGVIVGYAEPLSIWTLGGLPLQLPAQHTYKLAGKYPADVLENLALGWGLGSYRFTHYLTKAIPELPILTLPVTFQTAKIENILSATYLVRNLINFPANDLGTEELAQVGIEIAKRYKAKATIIRGEKLELDYPAIYTVGHGSARPPLLLDITWGKPNAPKVTLVGKGVVFDTGGLDIKTSSTMGDQKKDMGGAAHALALAQMIMTAKLNVRLRVLVPIVENSVSGTAMRPGDVLRTKSGKTVEINNTDAEGRLILADALYEAAQEQPQWIINFATLTGARSIALGTEIPCLFSNNDAMAASLFLAGQAHEDYIWRLPLWKPYWRHMKSPIADMSNLSNVSAGGAITAALFLEQFIQNTKAWAHFDFNAYNVSTQPGRPAGGEAMGLRACFYAIEKHFSN